MRPDKNGAFEGFDDMVEALEEQEDMVECKECFDLFPKVDCAKHEHGYVCPTCNRALQREPEIDSRMITTDLFDQEFPEVQDYDPDSTRDYRKEATLGDTLHALLADEYDAVDTYEDADELVQQSNFDDSLKDDVLDTLDHIKEEEEEHIEELKELCPECDPKEEKDGELEEFLDASVNLNLDGGRGNDVSVLSSHEPEVKGSRNLDEAAGNLYTAEDLETGELIAACYAASEDEAVDILTQKFTEKTGKTGSELEDCYVTLAENEAEAKLLVEQVLNEGPFSLGIKAKGMGRKAKRKVASAKNKDFGTILARVFNEGYVIICKMPAGQPQPPQTKDVYPADQLNKAMEVAKTLSKVHKGASVHVVARKIDKSIYGPATQEIIDIKGNLANIIATFRGNAVVTDNSKTLADKLLEASEDDDILGAVVDGADPRDAVAEAEEAEETTGEDPAEDPKNNKPKVAKQSTPEPEEEEEEEFSVEDEEEEDEDFTFEEEEEEDPVEAAKQNVFQALGKKADPAKYSDKSYAVYERNYDNFVKFVNSKTSVDAIKKIDINGIKTKLNSLLKPRDTSTSSDASGEGEGSDGEESHTPDTPENEGEDTGESSEDTPEETPEETPDETAEETPEETTKTPTKRSKTLGSQQIASMVRNVFAHYGKTPEAKIINNLTAQLKKKLGESLTEGNAERIITEILKRNNLITK